MRRVLMAAVAAVMAVGVAGPAAAADGPALFAWGSNSYGQLGNPDVAGSSLVPVDVTTSGVLAGERVTQVSAGDSHSCVVADGKAYCWGRNSFGQLGAGPSSVGTDSPVPLPVLGLPQPVTSIVTGISHTCALANATPYCWGRNSAGQLGDGTESDRALPVPVDTSGVLKGKTITALTAGGYHTCALAGGSAYCWGDNGYGQLGDGNSSTNATSPLAADAAAFTGMPVTTIRAGEFHTCALAGGKAFCWGVNDRGQLGDGTTTERYKPVAVQATGELAGKTLARLGSGRSHTCAVADGTPYCWGSNERGQLGNNSAVDSSVPVPVVTTLALAGRTVTELRVGAEHSCVLADGLPFCWGYNSDGQLGTGVSGDKSVPTAVLTDGVLKATVARALSAGGNHVVYTAAQVPTAPRAVVAAPGPGAVTVSWDLPEDDGGRAISGYRVSTAGGSCETTGLSCTVSGLISGQAYTFDVVARNAIGDSAVGSVVATPGAVPVDPPVIIKVKQSFPVPKKLKKRGVTVVAVKGAKTSAGQPVTTTVKTKGKVKVIRKGGAVKIRSFGAKKWRVTVTQTAPGTETAEPLSQRTVYVNGKRR